MAMINGFDRVAPYYDLMKQIVFGSSIRRSQLHFLPQLPAIGDILVLGGGTGEILEPLLRNNLSRRIWYVEASSRMLELAEKGIGKDLGRNVTFIHGTEARLPDNIMFDGIITNFFVDLFPDGVLLDLCRKLEPRLKGSGRWIVTDFVDTGKKWHRMLLSLMYSFFVYTCKIEANALPRWEEKLQQAGLERMDCQQFYNEFIKTCVYVKVAKGF